MQSHKFPIQSGIYHFVMGKEDDDQHIFIDRKRTVSYQCRAVVEKENMTLGFIS